MNTLENVQLKINDDSKKSPLWILNKRKVSNYELDVLFNDNELNDTWRY